MTDGRPPKEGASPPEAEAEDGQDGRRSQTRSVAGNRSQPGSAAAPRATFAPATSTPPKSAPAQAPHTPRSVFQNAPSARPGASDPDKTVKRPYPSDPNTWGKTLKLGETDPLQAGGPTADEKTVQVARSAFAKTLLSGDALAQAQQPPERPAPNKPGGTFPPPGAAADAAEPLRVPSNRPAPAPWNTARQNPAAPSGTMLMPGSPAAPDPSAAAREAASQQHKQTPVAPVRHVEPARPTPAGGKQTIRVGSAELAPPASPAGQQPPQSRRAPTPPVQQAPAAAQVPAPSSAAAKARAAAPAQSAESAARGSANASQPLQLQLHARDVIQQATMSDRPVLPRTRGPLLAALMIIAVVAGIAAWFALRGGAPEATTDSDATRNSAVLAPTEPPAAAPAQPVAQPPAATATPPATTAPAVQPAQPTAAKPAAATPAPQVAAPASKPAAEPAAKRATSRPRARDSEPRRAREKAAARPAETEVPAGVEEAREALRALESEPVIKIKPKAADEPELEPPSVPDLPEPPPAP